MGCLYIDSEWSLTEALSPAIDGVLDGTVDKVGTREGLAWEKGFYGLDKIP
jgi:hypothetical protein